MLQKLLYGLIPAISTARASTDLLNSKIPPSNTIDKIPIGSSSLSMYPGYSPADHQYGQAAQEFGQEWAEAKRKGADFQPAEDGPQYEIGQSKKRQKKSIEESRAELAKREALRDRAVRREGPAHRMVPENQALPNSKPAESLQLPKRETGEEAWKARAAMSEAHISQPQGNHKQQKANEKRPRSKPVFEESPNIPVNAPDHSTNAEPSFFIDSNPTPVNLAGTPDPQMKRAASNEHDDRMAGEEVPTFRAKKSKRSKIDHSYAEPAPLADNVDPNENSADATSSTTASASRKVEPRIEFEDITAEVDARLAEKEERRKRKLEKKRKRESGNEGGKASLESVADLGPKDKLECSAQAIEERPKKKKAKKVNSSGEQIGISENTADATTVEAGMEVGKKRKADSSEESQELVVEGEKKKQKVRKGKEKSSI